MARRTHAALGALLAASALALGACQGAGTQDEEAPGAGRGVEGPVERGGDGSTEGTTPSRSQQDDGSAVPGGTDTGTAGSDGGDGLGTP